MSSETNEQSKLRRVLQILNFLNHEEINAICKSADDLQCIKNQEKLTIKIILNKALKLSLLQKINSYNSNEFDIKIDLKKLNPADLSEYIYHFIKTNEIADLISNWKIIDFDIIGDDLIIKYQNEIQEQIWRKIKKDLEVFLKNKIGIKMNEIKFIFDEEIHQRELNILQQNEIDKQKYIDDLNRRANKKDFAGGVKLNINDPVTKISELDITSKYAVIQGTIYSSKVSHFKSGLILHKYFIFDDTGSLTLKKFFRNKDEKELFKKDDNVRLVISLENDVYNNQEELTGKIESFKIITEPQDNNTNSSDEPRIEWSLHTKMSSYDGIIDLKELKKFLLQQNAKSFAITDRFNVQNYPDIYKTFKNSGINPIYGVELEVLNDEILGVLNPTNQELNKCEYVIFDLETTGLYPVFDDIIEFGAVKMKNGIVMERKQFFMKPTIALSEKISKITHIYEKDLEGAISQKEGLNQIINFFGDAVLIAHNGIDFDFNFLNTKLEQYGFSKLKNCMIDTLIINRAIHSDYKSHSLEAICKKMGIVYDLASAHRADYDAELLAKVWTNMISELETQVINQINSEIQNQKLKCLVRGNFVAIYAKNNLGIKNIYEIVSRSHTNNFYNRPTVTWEMINKFQNNIIVTNLCIESDVISAAISKTDDELEKAIKRYDFISVCGPKGFEHEICNQNISTENYEKAIKRIITLAQKNHKKIIAVSNSYYLVEEEAKFHDVFVQLPTLNKRPHRFYRSGRAPMMHLRTTSQMREELSFLKDDNLINDLVLNNSNKISELIDNDITPIKDKLYPPIIEGVNDKVREQVYITAHNLYGESLPKIIDERIQKELDSIINNGYAVVYWISHLLVKESINDGYVVGSRGSVGSSLVATFLNITDVNPLPPHYLCNKCKYSDFDIPNEIEDGFDLPPKPCPNCGTNMEGDGHNILFEVFLGFYGDKVPDIDLNFSGLYQNTAHNFIKKIFGNEKTYRAGTISTIADKTSFANVKTYFEMINKKATESEIELFIKKCVDVKRTTGQHPGGIIVVPKEMDIYDFTPYNYPADDTETDWYTTHFAFEHIHDNLLKFDILGHDNPTILKMLKDLTGIDEKDIPHFDQKTMSLFSELEKLNITAEQILNETTGAMTIPEFGTKFVREMLSDTKPKTFADLIRISGLSHGTNVWIDNAKDLIRAGHKLNEIIACRDDIMSYLIEHKIEPKIAFNVMEDVRKGKKINDEYKLILREANIPEWYINSCDKIKYMFPKAHATAYVMHAWKFAWYKLNYPLEYYSTYFTIRANVFDIKTLCSDIEIIKEKYCSLKSQKNITPKEKDLMPIYEAAIEMNARGFKFSMVDIKKSDALNFIVDKENKSLICPFTAIDGLGEAVATSIINARQDKEFTDKEDFISRTKVSKQHIKSMEEFNMFKDYENTTQIDIFQIR